MKKHVISFHHASQGVRTAFTTQANLKFHLLAAAVVAGTAYLVRVSSAEALALILTIALVVLAEMLNTSLEFLSDAVTLKKNPFIKQAKDVAAGAVLVTAVLAVVVGGIVFIPKFL